MRVDWGLFLTILLAIVVARIVNQALLSKGSSNSSSTHVGAEINSPAKPVVIYQNPIQQFIAEKYPDIK